jgi:exopolyphosphatase/pppGpp-phosphohydrolase
MSHQETQERYEERKKEFLYEINQTGKYHILKEKMKKTVVRIVREHFGKSEAIKGLKKDERDQFYSDLYVFLVSEMRRTVGEMV